MKKLFWIAIIALCCSAVSAYEFRSSQIQYSRVKTAYSEKEEYLKKLFKQKNIDYASQNILIRAFKEEKELELWARSGNAGKFTLIKKYNICTTSGELGPKRKQGDGQTPEGFYYIDRFNPQSNFYLSLGINYPNASDKILSCKNPGGDIFIHGDCVSIGCIPLTDEFIKEVYVLAVEAKDNGQTRIPVHIFPCRFTNENWTNLQREYKDNPELISFWKNLKEGYSKFEESSSLCTVKVGADGKYIYQK